MQQSHISYAVKPVLSSQTTILLVIDPTLEIIDTAALCSHKDLFGLELSHCSLAPFSCVGTITH